MTKIRFVAKNLSGKKIFGAQTFSNQNLIYHDKHFSSLKVVLAMNEFHC